MENENLSYTKSFSIDLERKRYHDECKRRRKKRIIRVLILWAIIIIYFLSAFSKVNLKVKGNVYYTKDELVKIGYIDEDNLWWLFNSNDAKKVLETYEYIDSVTFNKSFLGVTLTINEIFPVGIKNNKYLMNNKTLVEKEAYVFSSKINSLTNFDKVENDYIDRVVNKYSGINLNIRNQFTSIEVVEDSNEYAYVKLFGYDSEVGYFVIKVDLVYLNIKFNGTKYQDIINMIKKENKNYTKDDPALVAYHYINENEYHVVSSFEEE